MDKIIEHIPEKNRSKMLEKILEQYVDKQGLGGIPKSDSDALLLYLYVVYSDENKFDSFRLGQRFKIKESKVKSLYETGLLKYAKMTWNVPYKLDKLLR